MKSLASDEMCSYNVLNSADIGTTAGPQCAVRNTPSARVATSALSKDEFLAALSLIEGSKEIEADALGYGDFAISENGKLMVIASGDWFEDTHVAALSHRGQVFAGRCTDRTDMFADLVGAERGEIKWRVAYEASDSDKLTLEGALPPDVRLALLAEPPREKIEDDDEDEDENEDEDEDEDEDEGLISYSAVLRAWSALIGFKPEYRSDRVFVSARAARVQNSRRTGLSFWERLMRPYGS